MGDSSGGLIDLVVYLAICISLLVVVSIVQAVISDPHHRYHHFRLRVRITKYVLAWYAISVSFTLFNKWFLNGWRKGGFPFPVGITALHMVVKLIITRIYNRCRPPEKRIVPLSCSNSLSSAVPIGVCTGVDVAFSNLSFLYISISFYTILKSGTLLWILFWAVLLRLEPVNCEIVAICLLVSGGVSIASFGEASFNWMGFALVAAACCLSGLRWSLTQILLGSDHGGDPITVLYHISPASALCCIPVFLLVELRPLMASHLLDSPAVAAEALLFIILGGFIAFALIFAEVKLVKISSSLTLGLFGNVKEVVTIGLSMLVFHDSVSLLNLLGMSLAIIGAIWYRAYKLKGRHVPGAPPGGDKGDGEQTGREMVYTQANTGIWHLDDEEDEDDEFQEEEHVML